MKPGQTTVLGLLIVLLALEAVRNKAVQGFLKTWLGNFRQALNSTTQPTSSNNSSGSQQSTGLTSSQQPPWINKKGPTWPPS